MPANEPASALARHGAIVGVVAVAFVSCTVTVFVCVTVIPMLVVAEAATDVVAKTFQTNVQAWLFQASRFFIADIVDERREVEQIAQTLSEIDSLRPMISGAIRSHAASLKTNRSITPKTASPKAALNLICRLKGIPRVHTT